MCNIIQMHLKILNTETSYRQLIIDMVNASHRYPAQVSMIPRLTQLTCRSNAKLGTTPFNCLKATIYQRDIKNCLDNPNCKTFVPVSMYRWLAQSKALSSVRLSKNSRIRLRFLKGQIPDLTCCLPKLSIND